MSVRSIQFLFVVLTFTFLWLSGQANAITYNVTPHDVGAVGGVQLVGGTIMTNGEIGEGLSFSDLEPTFQLELTNGETTQILTELATTIAMSVDEPLFDVTEETITFVPEAGQFIRFTADESPFSGLFWSGESPHGSGLLAVEVDGISDITTPPPIDIGNFAVISTIPEPSTLVLATLGLLSLGITRRRRQRA